MGNACGTSGNYGPLDLRDPAGLSRVKRRPIFGLQHDGEASAGVSAG